VKNAAKTMTHCFDRTVGVTAAAFLIQRTEITLGMGEEEIIGRGNGNVVGREIAVSASGRDSVSGRAHGEKENDHLPLIGDVCLVEQVE
jgi:hypothetical protein